MLPDRFFFPQISAFRSKVLQISAMNSDYTDNQKINLIPYTWYSNTNNVMTRIGLTYIHNNAINKHKQPKTMHHKLVSV